MTRAAYLADFSTGQTLNKDSALAKFHLVDQHELQRPVNSEATLEVFLKTIPNHSSYMLTWLFIFSFQLDLPVLLESPYKQTLWGHESRFDC